ncbi:YhdH/YhfP family quinone oxidoreductase [Pseudomonadota bacterium]
MNTFKAFRIHNDNGTIRAGIESIALDDLSEGEVVIKAAYSGINFKDALAGTGKGQILKHFPLVGGVDVSGVVHSSNDKEFKQGDEVLVCGAGLGETFDGGYAEYVRVKADCVVPLPKGLSLFDAMVMGTPAFTAALALHRLEENRQSPCKGPMLITGASGGVGNLAVDIFANGGYEVVAVTGKESQDEKLKQLGANQVLHHNGIKMGQHPLEKSLWGGAVDTVGGDTLAWLTRTIKPWGNIASIGLAADHELNTTVMPFILRGVSILGISSANCPHTLRRKIWQRLGNELRPQHLDIIHSKTIQIDELMPAFEEMLARKTDGRIVVKLP